MRLSPLAAIVPLMALAFAWPAAAQTRCGNTELLSPGETIDQMAARCGTTVGAILGANPGLTGQSLTPGVQVNMPVSQNPVSQNDDDWLSQARSALKGAGDTITGAATAAGRSASEYLSEQPDLNRDVLEFGERLGLPGVRAEPEQGPALNAAFPDGRSGGRVHLIARGLPGNAPIVITGEAEGVPPEVLWNGSANPAGRVEATVTLPPNMSGRKDVRFIAKTADDRLRLASDVVDTAAD